MISRESAGVTLPSNINPAYESLDLAHPEEGFRRALAQLREWSLRVDHLPEGARKRPVLDAQEPPECLAIPARLVKTVGSVPEDTGGFRMLGWFGKWP